MKSSDMEFFHQATMKICGSLNIDIILSSFKKFLKGYLPVDSITLGFFDSQKKTINHVCRVSEQDSITMGKTLYASEEVSSFLQTLKKASDSVQIMNHPEDVPVMYHWCKSLGMPDGSFLSMELALDNQYIGFLGIFSRGMGRYNKEHARLMNLLQGQFAVALNNVLQHRELIQLRDMLKDDNQFLKKQLLGRAGDEIIGARSGLKGVMELVNRVASLRSQVILLGETGVGKEVIANAIHNSSSRAEGPFIKVNCGAIPENLIDSELFGHEKGAFTGAINQKRGRFERAHNGSIFLDEIGELPLQAQVRLLRVIQNREIERVGGTEPIFIDIRIIAATHRNLEQMVAEGKFREDLWFRLNVLPITIPPLRERTQDIPDLVRYFIRKKARDMNFDYIPEPAPGFMEALQKHIWKGNIRELENTVERVMIRHMGAPKEKALGTDDLTTRIIQTKRPAATRPQTLESLDSVMASHIMAVMAHTRGKIQGKDGAAAILGIHPSTLRSRMKRLGIPHGRLKPLKFQT